MTASEDAAAAIARTAFSVNSSGSPGPAPTSHTLPVLSMIAACVCL